MPSGPKLDALTAEKVFGWKSVHQYSDGGGLYGKRQDKLGRWRSAKIPTYSTETLHAYPIEERMEQLGRLDRYLRELFRITRANNIPRLGFSGSTLPSGDQKLWDNTARSFL